MKTIISSGLVAGVAMLALVMFILNPLFIWFWPEHQAIYENTAIFRSMEDPLMMLFMLHPIAIALALAWVWNKTKHLFTGTLWQNAWHFSLIYFAIAGIPGFIINYSSFNLPLMMIVSWIVMTYSYGLIAGLVFGKMNPAR